ncbi:unnamed protein product [Staurois parvus]|uniref:Secreted protein n=1 Tax=Staurois parvus TaxID=386267 RepID=A0ABN9AHC9_9NEOB|nr:unnamed protein product [Staurois parvus]
MLCIALGDVRLRCSCSAMETHFMTFSVHGCCANVKATQFGGLQLLTLQTVGNFCTLCASEGANPLCVAYHFVVELLLFPVASTLL